MFNLSTIITSKTRYSLLELFIKNPSLELGVRETSRKINSSVMLVRNELILLQSIGILKSRHVANSIQFSLDNTCPAVEHLKSLLDLGKENSQSPSAHPQAQPIEYGINQIREAIDDD